MDLLMMASSDETMIASHRAALRSSRLRSVTRWKTVR